MKSLEATIQKKVDVTELQKLQKKVEENENKIRADGKQEYSRKNMDRYHGNTREENRRCDREVTEGKR